MSAPKELAAFTKHKNLTEVYLLSDFQRAWRRPEEAVKAVRLYVFPYVNLGWNTVQSLVINCISTHSQCNTAGAEPRELCIHYWCRWSPVVWESYISCKYSTHYMHIFCNWKILIWCTMLYEIFVGVTFILWIGDFLSIFCFLLCGNRYFYDLGWLTLLSCKNLWFPIQQQFIKILSSFITWGVMQLCHNDQHQSMIASVNDLYILLKSIISTLCLFFFILFPFQVISYCQRKSHKDVHRFEKISNIIKQFKLSCR